MAHHIDGKRVSRDWYTVLKHARAKGTTFHLNSGRRTMAEQTALWRAFIRRGRRPPLVAFPLPTAPHIAVGRQAHALDVDTGGGGETHLQTFLERAGLHPSNPVASEAWHLVVPERELRRYAARIRRVNKRHKR